MFFRKKRTRQVNATVQYLRDEEVDPELDVKIRKLLSGCFPKEKKFRKQRFNNEMPQNRWLVYDEGKLIAHLASHEKFFIYEDHRFSFCGLAELCVREEFRGQRIADTLFAYAEKFHSDMDYSIFLGSREGYRRYGYVNVGNINFPDEHNYSCPNARVKCLVQNSWPDGTVVIPGKKF